MLFHPLFPSLESLKNYLIALNIIDKCDCVLEPGPSVDTIHLVMTPGQALLPEIPCLS